MPIKAIQLLSISVLTVVATLALLALSSGDTTAVGPIHTTYNPKLKEDGDNLPTLGPPAQCGDAADNDADTLTDATDPDCQDWTPRFTPVYDSNLCMGLHSGFAGGPPPLPGLQGPLPYPGGCGPDKSDALSSNPNITTTFVVPEGHYNYAQDSFVSFLPPEFDVASAADIPGTGATIGGLQSTTTLGLTNNACNSSIFPEFIFWEATTDITNVFVSPPAGTAARWGEGANIAGTLSGPTNTDPYPGSADNDSNIVEKYPDISNKLFDPDGSGDPINADPYLPVIPHARYASSSQVPPGGDFQILQIYVFEPGQLQAAFFANPNQRTHPFSSMGPELGWTHVTILNDPIADKSSPNPITDFCTVLGTKTGLLGKADVGNDGNAGNDVARVTAPSDMLGSIDGQGTHIARSFSQSTRDLDGDAVENAVDTCLNLYNLDNPYAPQSVTNNKDGDMLDPACDPNPAVNEGFGDVDGDGFANAQDNCPLIANPNQLNDELTVGRSTAAYDGGPGDDSIGTACDANSTDATQSAFLQSIGVSGYCIGGVDANNDGFCDAAGGSAATQDADGDTYPDETEEFMSTDMLTYCPQEQAKKKHQAWPPDFDANGTVNILDIVQLTPPVFNTSAGDANYTKRKDLNADGKINILDIVKLTPPVFNTKCKQLIEVCRYRVTGGNIAVEKWCSGAPAVVKAVDNVTVTYAGRCDPITDKEKVFVFGDIPRTAADVPTGNVADVLTLATAKCTTGPIANVGPLTAPARGYSMSGQEYGSGDFVCSSVAIDNVVVPNMQYTVMCRLWSQ